jgi:hypothetical protein
MAVGGEGQSYDSLPQPLRLQEVPQEILLP